MEMSQLITVYVYPEKNGYIFYWHIEGTQAGPNIFQFLIQTIQ